MSREREIPEAIQWHEGMLLAPQHFQQAAQRQEGLLAYHAAALAPFHWGVFQLEIDGEKLVAGSFSIRRLEAILPDGLVVSYTEEDRSELSLDLKPFADETQQRHFTVHLAVAASVSNLAAVSGEMARYDSQAGRSVVDANTGRGEMAIPRLRPHLRLLVAEDVPKEGGAPQKGVIPKKFVSLPLARIHHSDKSFSRSTFEPPRLRISVGSPIGQKCQEIAQRLRAKAIFLAEQAQSLSVTERQALLLETKQQVNSLVAALPQFEAMLNTDRSHPFALYLALCNLVGQVASISHKLIPPELKAYDHNDLEASFESPRRYLDQTLDEGINETYLGIPMVWKDGAFHTYFEEDWMERRLVLGVRGRHSVPEETTSRWIQQSLIGSESLMPRMEHHRILGVERKRLDADADLVAARGINLYRLIIDAKTDSKIDSSKFVVGGEKLQIKNLDDRGQRTRPDALILYVRNEN